MPNVAFVTGCNGITGSAVASWLSENTNSSEWSKIYITSRSPLQLPLNDKRIEFIALDFSQTPDALAAKMKPFASEITHCYFSSYVHKDDFKELNIANSALFQNFLEGLVQHASSLKSVTLQTGGKHYNVHLAPQPSPARETDPRSCPHEQNFYYAQEDCLIDLGKKHGFSWNVIRPEVIIGTTHKANGMNEALTIAMYFLICAEQGEEAVMPTNQRYWEGAEDVSSSESIADITIYASTHDNCQNQAFNHANGDYFQWKYMWPRLAEYYGAKASSNQKFEKPYPKEGDVQLEKSFYEWSHDKQAVWDDLCERRGCPGAKQTFSYGTWQFQDWVFQRTWSATMSINKARKFGWTKHVGSYDNFIEVFEQFETLGLLPKRS